ncbi:MAG: CBS domain-containing protein [Agarilytica sp.]
MLNVIDNGMRIETPWYAIFPPRATEKSTATAATPVISDRDQIRESNTPHAKPGQQAYQQVKHITEERHKVAVAKEIMSDTVATLSIGANLLTAWAELNKHGVRHMPVVDAANRLQGIISDRDVLKAWAGMASTNRHVLESLSVTKIMTVRVLTGSLNTSIRDIADAMTLRHFGAVPLLNDEHHVVGIVTRSDILRAIVHQAPMDLWS